MKRRLAWLFGGTATCLAALVWLGLQAGCPPVPTDDGMETEFDVATRNFPTSFHGDRHGKAVFYEADDGFNAITGIPFDELGCKGCHASTYADGSAVDAATYAPGCRDCHADPANPGGTTVADSICLGCHGRQGAEQQLFSDVHRSAGMGCTACHTKREMHGDGIVYDSFLSEGASDADCVNCHVEGGTADPPGANTYHSIHGDAVHCSACHVKSVSSCYNCHFETEVTIDKKRFFGQSPRTGFKMLVNYEGKVHTATFQALSYGGETFVALAPFFGHSVTRDDITCGDCHLMGGSGNANLQEYADTGVITVTSWNSAADGAERLVGPNGVIPIPTDWKTSLSFTFLDYTGEATDAVNGADNLPLWDLLKVGADGSHMPIGTPLTEEQMNKLMNN